MQEIWQHIFVNWIVGHQSDQTLSCRAFTYVGNARNACLKKNMHLELANIEQTKQIKQESEYTSCNPEQTAAKYSILFFDAILFLDHIAYSCD